MLWLSLPGESQHDLPDLPFPCHFRFHMVSPCFTSGHPLKTDSNPPRCACETSTPLPRPKLGLDFTWWIWWWTCDEITLTRLKYKLESEMLKNHGKSTYTIIQHKYAFSRFAYISRCMCCTCQWPYALCQFQNCITDITEAGIHWIILNHIGSCRINWIHDDLQAVLLDQFLTDVLRQVRAAQVARVGEEVMVSRLTSD